MFLKTWLPDFESTFPHQNAWYSLNIRRFGNYFCISDFLEKRMIGLSTLLQIPPFFCRLRAHRKSLFFVYCSAVFAPTPGQITICIFTLRHHRATGQQNRHAGTEKAALRRNSPPGAWRPRQWIWNAAASVAGTVREGKRPAVSESGLIRIFDGHTVTPARNTPSRGICLVS